MRIDTSHYVPTRPSFEDWYLSSWRMSEHLLRMGGWHVVGTPGDNPNDSKEPVGMLSADNLTKGISG